MAPRRPNENPAEDAIREIKVKWYTIQQKYKIPNQLWDYGLTYVVETQNMTVNNSRYANGRAPTKIIIGETPNISEYIDFKLYDWVMFRPNAGVGESQLGRYHLQHCTDK